MRHPALCLALFLGACAADKGLPAPSDLQEGLNIFEASNGVIEGAFVEQGEVVYFEAIRGPATPQAMRDNFSDVPLFEVDARFRDRDGNTLLMQVGGHSPMDPTWSEESVVDVPLDRRVNDFRLADLASQALAARGLGSDVAGEVAAIASIGPIVNAGTVPLPALPDLLPEAALYSHYYLHDVQMYDQCITVSACIGRHGATIGWRAQVNAGHTAWGAYVQGTVTCNHGTCANQMGFKCECQTAGNYDRTSHVHNEFMCSTTYDWWSTSGKHNSNDDTERQWEAVRGNYHPSTTGGQCGDSSSNNTPGCGACP